MLFKTLAVGLLLAIGEIVNGNIRVRVLHHLCGKKRAKKISFFSGTTIIYAIAWFTLPWLSPANYLDCYKIGFSGVLPDLGLNTIDARHFYMLLLIVPAVAYDMLKNGMLHRSYLIGLSLIVIWVVSAHYLWGSSWWVETASKLFGV